MITTTWRILWIPVAGAILILRTGEAEPRLRGVVGTIARHCSMRPVVNVWAIEKVEPSATRGRAAVTQRGPTRRWSRTRWPAWAGATVPLNLSISPATANVAVLDSVSSGRTRSARTRLRRPRVVITQSRLVVTDRAGIWKL